MKIAEVFGLAVVHCLSLVAGVTDNLVRQLQSPVVGAFPRNAPAGERANTLHSAHFTEMRPPERANTH